MADIGLPQTQMGGAVEQPLLTAGDDLNLLKRILPKGAKSYSAKDVLNYLLQK